MQAYEELLDRRPYWAIVEGSMHFEEKSAVYQSLRAIAARRDELQVPYAVAGGMRCLRMAFAVSPSMLMCS